MTVCWFGSFGKATVDVKRLSEMLAATPGMQHGLIYTPSTTRDPYLDDGPPPDLVVQLYFAEIAELEGALAGHLQRLASIGTDATQQATLVRRYPVPDPVFRTPPGELPCTYLVAYQGKAENLTAWLEHYIADHPPIMARFPRIRQIEIYTCIDWCGGLPVRRVAHMQRNKVVFDSQASLTAALNSPIRHEMRTAFHGFPPFTGPITHFPMTTHIISPRPLAGERAHAG